MKICTKCVLPESFPNITFDANGVCNYCQAFKGEEKLKEDKTEYLERFKKLITEVKGKADYDCTVSYSGGKDSSYTLYVLKEVFHLRVLALVMDNGFLSPQAFKNITTLTETLGVDSLIFKPNFQLLKKIFCHAVEHPMYSPKTLERASTICTSCIGLVKFIFLKIALEKKIPIMAWGWSPGQAPIRSSIMKMNPALFKSTQEVLKKPMQDVAGVSLQPYFLNEAQFQQTELFPYNVSPLAFMDYDEHAIIEKLKTLGWKEPDDVDTNSTNCLLNSFSNHIHMDRYNFHPYAFEIAEMVRSGVMTREDGLAKISNLGVDATIEFAKKKLGI
jgi:Predicted ATPase of the PP-loop superfamily implicated in cell cycle control